jgi:hypothetical protein
VLDERSNVGSVGCSCRDVTVSVCDSRNARRGADVLRWSLLNVKGWLIVSYGHNIPDVDRRLMGTIVWVLDAASYEVVVCIADER